MCSHFHQFIKHYQIPVDNDKKRIDISFSHSIDTNWTCEEIAIDLHKNKPLNISNDKKCTLISTNNKNSILTDCSYLLRIANALEYYHSLKLPQNPNTQNEFVHFCVNDYSLFLEDYIHLICNHSDSFHQIGIAFQHNYNLNLCYDVYQCPWTQKHYLNSNYESNFYINMFDTIHVNLFHLKEIGLDTCNLQIDRFDHTINSRFNIMVSKINSNESKVSETNMLSEMRKNNNIQKHVLNKMEKYLNEHEYDTCSFSTGIVFWYWKYYVYVTNEDINHQKTYYDHNKFQTYEMNDVFVKKYYYSLKREILACGFANIKQYHNLIVEKAHKYMQTQKCKQMKCIERNDRLHYNIAYGTALSVSYLYALIFYCDFGDFYTDFVSTFRKIKWNETIKSVGNRNSKYFHISKYLRELVQYYGINGYTGEYINKQYESGPFYIGISFITTVPSFSICLNGPTSTSKRIEVVTRCCSANGIIIQLNNQRKYTEAQEENCFNTCWISKYSEEQEFIWTGGRYKMEIESIILIKTHKNYKTIINTFYKFESILSGQYIDYKDVTFMDIEVITCLINDYFHIQKTNKFDSYIKNTFHSFLTNKRQIIFNLHEMDQYNFCLNRNGSDIAFKTFVNIIMHSIQRQSWYTVNINDNKNINLFKSIIFELFPQLNEIIIYSSYKSNHYGFNISLLIKMLMDITLPKCFKTIRIKDIVDESYGDQGGLKFAFFSMKMETLNKQKIHIDFKAKQGYNKKEDWVVLNMLA